jgi:hypothetical protein
MACGLLIPIEQITLFPIIMCGLGCTLVVQMVKTYGLTIMVKNANAMVSATTR